MDPESLEIRARRGGMICCVGESSIDVLDLYEHGSDVDYESGNLRIEGALMVRGDVLQMGLAENTRSQARDDRNVRDCPR